MVQNNSGLTSPIDLETKIRERYNQNTPRLTTETQIWVSFPKTDTQGLIHIFGINFEGSKQNSKIKSPSEDKNYYLIGEKFAATPNFFNEVEKFFNYFGLTLIEARLPHTSNIEFSATDTAHAVWNTPISHTVKKNQYTVSPFNIKDNIENLKPAITDTLIHPDHKEGSFRLTKKTRQ